jgi:hypothetical protein
MVPPVLGFCAGRASGQRGKDEAMAGPDAVLPTTMIAPVGVGCSVFLDLHAVLPKPECHDPFHAAGIAR